MVQALLIWHPNGKGRVQPPQLNIGEKYSAIIHFPEEETFPPKQAWSVIIYKLVEFNPMVWQVDLSFLVPEAPSVWLIQNTRFELYEGARCVAGGKIISIDPCIKDSLIQLYQIFFNNQNSSEKESAAFKLITNTFNQIPEKEFQTFTDSFLNSLLFDFIPIFVVEYILLVTKLRAHLSTSRKNFIQQFKQYLTSTNSLDLIEAEKRLVRLT